VISDYITLNFVDYIFDDPGRYTGLENLVAVYGYAIVIYCDFSGYSDIAIGIGKWLGFNIPVNFLSPYQSKNITEFWRRWHISLSSWLRDYLYIPLGGNRGDSFGTWFFPLVFFAGVFIAGMQLFDLIWWKAAAISGGGLLLFILSGLFSKKRNGVATNMNLLTTMLLGGFWHGASWNYIVWGALHGIALVLHKSWSLLTGRALAPVRKGWLYKALTILITFHFVCFCWIFFKTTDFDAALTMIYQITNNFSFSVWPAFFANYEHVLYIIAFAYLLHTIPDNYADRVINRFQRIPMIAYLFIFFAFVFLYGYFKAAEPVMPIYLQF
jgi:alginate O-acetyltransferase complex protein AlgI